MTAMVQRIARGKVPKLPFAGHRSKVEFFATVRRRRVCTQPSQFYRTAPGRSSAVGSNAGQIWLSFPSKTVGLVTPMG